MKKVTSQDVADKAGVSQATVSLVLNNSSKISFSEETKERVLAAAAELGYKLPAHRARRKQKSTGLLLIFTPSLTNYYFTELLQAVQEYARIRGYRVILCNTFRSSEVERHYLDNLPEVDGIIYTFLPSYPRIVERIMETTPVVLIGEKGYNLNICSIELSNRMAGIMMGEHLYGLGHRRFVFISTPLNPNPFTLAREKRLQGLDLVFEKYNLVNPITVIAPEVSTEKETPDQGVSYEYEVGRAMTLRAIENDCYGATAFICVNDMTALGAMSALRDSGLRIPEDISVSGFDNVFPSKISTPPLTTVDHQLQKRCKAAIDELLSMRSEGEGQSPVNKIEYSPLLLVRESTGPAPSPKEKA